MRLLTHNTLYSPIKGLKSGFPLSIDVQKYEVRSTDFNPGFLGYILPTLDWGAVLVAAVAVGVTDLPAIFDSAMMNDESFMRAMHTVLLEIHVEEGTLICPETGKTYPIITGIPDMRLAIYAN